MTTTENDPFAERESEFAAERHAVLGSERAEALAALESEFTDLFARVRRSYLDGAERIASGLSPSAYKLFGIIARRGPLTPSDLAERTLSDRSQVSRLIRELEDHQLIQRTPDPRDGRSFSLSATENGLNRLLEARRLEANRSIRALSDWEIDDINQLARLLNALTEAMEPGSEPDPSPQNPPAD